MVTSSGRQMLQIGSLIVMTFAIVFKPDLLHSAVSEMPAREMPARILSWTSNDGKVIQAGFVRLDGEAVVVRMNDGKEFKVSFSRLSNESIVQAKLEAARNLLVTVTTLSKSKKPEDISKGIANASKALEIAEEMRKTSSPTYDAYLLAWQSLNSLGGLFDARGHSGDKERAFDYRMRTVSVAEECYSGDPNKVLEYQMLVNTYYTAISEYEKRGAAGDLVAAYEYSVKLYRLLESALLANGSNRTTPSRLAITAIMVARLSEKAQKQDAKEWMELACGIYYAQEKTAEGLTPQDKANWQEIEKKLGR